MKEFELIKNLAIIVEDLKERIKKLESWNHTIRETIIDLARGPAKMTEAELTARMEKLEERIRNLEAWIHTIKAVIEEINLRS